MNVKTAFLQSGPNKIELLEALSDDSPIAKFIAKKGEGIHHVAFEVEDIRAEMERLKNEGFVLLNDAPKLGADNKWVCFVHPNGVVGVLRLLHRKTDQIITGKVDIGGRGRFQFSRQVARKDRAVHRLVAQLDANFRTIAIDEFCRLAPTNQGHVVTCHQQLCRKQ